MNDILQPAWRAQRPRLANVTVCDGLLPWTEVFLPPGADLAKVLRRFKCAGVDHLSLTAAAGNDGPLEALKRLGWFRRELAAHPVAVRVALNRADVLASRAPGVVSVAFHFQTATPLLEDLDMVDAFYAAGVSRAILAYNEANAAGDGCHETRNGGLTTFGRSLVERMDTVGMRVDLSHCGERTSMDAIGIASRPPVFSHSNARALFDHERNITDAQIKACAARGGYIGVNGVGMFLGVNGPAIPRAMAEHVAHMALLAGAERVGLGLDFMYLEGSDYGFFHGARGRWPRGYPAPPWAFLQPEQFGEVVLELERKGFTQDELAGILGENYLRLVA